MLGERTETDTAVHPPMVTRPPHEFSGRLGDELVESFPVFLISSALASTPSVQGLRGFSLADAETTLSDEPRHCATARRSRSSAPAEDRITGRPAAGDFTTIRSAPVSGLHRLALIRRMPAGALA
ncbi:MAG TPA: hypothetical protein VH372_15460 [Actinospica sp.]|nr:hypothetical protein [Actinospica sp.]